MSCFTDLVCGIEPEILEPKYLCNSLGELWAKYNIYSEKNEIIAELWKPVPGDHQPTLGVGGGSGGGRGGRVGERGEGRGEGGGVQEF